ncbi:efflux transporter outer membrane subunit [Myroides indicus]|uniref:NodT family efflux transporter outer membrane factor (OMF) lipoprotein n=1 Tax=Myroides indicus TaxID=1323422 RepID=A0A4R7F425_9FLAO|nr:efflux transporter outer membrane subunit [Myroides indicus]TDS64351.1 NodT family efflux transporter outer membrane factor (OMF) lipoprotein [Myroides indicus]
MKRTPQYVATLGMMSILFSCQITKTTYQTDYQPQELFRSNQGIDTTSSATIPWRTFFRDEYLQGLIEEGLTNNLDVKMSLTRIEAARANLSQSKASFFPDLTVEGTMQRARMSYPQSFGFFKYATLHEVEASTTWELDVWGKLASAKRSAYYKFLKTEVAQQAIQTQLIAQISQYYYQLLVLDRQIDIVECTLENRAQDVHAMKQLKASTIVTEADVVQSEVNYLEAQIALPAIQKQRQEIENALSVLLGRIPGEIKRGVLEIQSIPNQISVGVAAELLQNRPDVQMEELALAAYFEDIQVVKRSFYPNLMLTASFGYSSYLWKDWFTPTGLFAQLTGGLLQPIFNKRQNKTRLALTKATYQEQLYRFQQSVLQAGKEVSNALYAYQIAEEQRALRQVQVEKLALAVDYTKKLMLYNRTTTYTDVLTSEQAYLYAALEMATNEGEKWQAIIQLYRSLGGGWKE